MFSRIVADRTRLGCVILAVVASANVARAQTPPVQSVAPQDAALAQSLFDEGRRAMKDGMFAAACPKLAESQRLDPALGTLLNLAVCNERLGRTASAWAEYRDAESTAKRDGQGERAAYARNRAAALEAHLSRLVVARAATNVDPGLDVRLDGASIGGLAFETPVPVDPGAHRLDVNAPGKKGWSVVVAIGAGGDRQSVEVPSLEEAPSPQANVAPEVPAAQTALATPPATPQEPPTPTTARHGARSWILATGIVGVSGLALGAVAGTHAMVKWSDRRDLCVGDTCSAAGVDASQAAKRWAVTSDVAFGVGIAGLIAAGTIFALSRGGTDGGIRVVPVASAAGGGVVIGGAW